MKSHKLRVKVSCQEQRIRNFEFRVKEGRFVNPGGIFGGRVIDNTHVFQKDLERD